MTDHTTVAIVTGGSRGIGGATAIRLAKDYGAVTIVARSADSLAADAREIRAVGAKVPALPFDLKEPAAASEVVHRTVATFGRIDALATVAGSVSQADLCELDDALASCFCLSSLKWPTGVPMLTREQMHLRRSWMPIGQIEMKCWRH